MNEPILSVKNLSKTFKLHGREDVKAVSNVTFDLFPGETLGVIGESGSGKTTLVNLITGLLPATEGSVSLDGIDCGTCGKSCRLFFRRRRSPSIPDRHWVMESARACATTASQKQMRCHVPGIC